MFKWMVAVDGSENARDAFNTALHLMDKRRDELYVISTVQSSGLSLVGYQKYSGEIEDQHKQYLMDYTRRCEEQGVRYCRPLLARGSHVGNMICKASDQKGIDFLVLGRRGMNRFSRMVTGSTSKYCMENASCNIIVIKGSYYEERGSWSEVQELEEIERQRRIKELGKPEEHYSSRNEIRDLEERERNRRLREREDEDAIMRKGEHEAALIRHLKQLEEEKMRRGVGLEQYTGRLGERIDRLQLND